MIIAFLFNLIVIIIGSIFSLLPTVTTLPTINGVDVDSAMVVAMGELHTFTTAFWPLAIMFNGFLFIMAYYAFKVGLRFIIGHRAPS